MKTTSGRIFIQVLEKNGWTLLRIKGSHHIYGKSGIDVRLSVPIHGDKPLKKGLLKHLLNIAGLKESDLEY